MKVLLTTVFAVHLLGSVAQAQSNEFVWVYLNTNPNRPELPKSVVDSLQKTHIGNIEWLAAEGKLLAAGPFEGGGGMFVFRPTTIDSVKTWVGTDPAVRAGRFLLEYLPYRPIVGSICKVGEGYKMISYTSVRLETGGSIDGDALVRMALLAVTPADTIIAAGSYGDRGGFLVFKNKVDESRFAELKAVKDGSATVKRRGLFIAKGSFCE